MFYTSDLLVKVKCGKFAPFWSAAHHFKLSRQQYLELIIERACDDLLEYIVPKPGVQRPRFSLYLSSVLTHGIVLVYAKQYAYLLEDLTNLWKNCKGMRFVQTGIDLQETSRNLNVADGVELFGASWLDQAGFGVLNNASDVLSDIYTPRIISFDSRDFHSSFSARSSDFFKVPRPEPITSPQQVRSHDEISMRDDFSTIAPPEEFGLGEDFPPTDEQFLQAILSDTEMNNGRRVEDVITEDQAQAMAIEGAAALAPEAQLSPLAVVGDENVLPQLPPGLLDVPAPDQGPAIAPGRPLLVRPSRGKKRRVAFADAEICIPSNQYKIWTRDPLPTIDVHKMAIIEHPSSRTAEQLFSQPSIELRSTIADAFKRCMRTEVFPVDERQIWNEPPYFWPDLSVAEVSSQHRLDAQQIPSPPLKRSRRSTLFRDESPVEEARAAAEDSFRRRSRLTGDLDITREASSDFPSAMEVTAGDFLGIPPIIEEEREDMAQHTAGEMEFGMLAEDHLIQRVEGIGLARPPSRENLCVPVHDDLPYDTPSRFKLSHRELRDIIRDRTAHSMGDTEAEKSVYFHDICPMATTLRLKAAKAFSLLLDLCGKQYVKPKQTMPFGPIELFRGERMGGSG